MTGDASLRLEDVPAIAARFRLQYEPAQSSWVLLYPEGMVKLSHSAAEIMRRIDGSRTIEAVLSSLEQAFPGADLRPDVLSFLEIAHERGWIVPR